jgi:hypothetical protein
MFVRNSSDPNNISTRFLSQHDLCESGSLGQCRGRRVLLRHLR